MTSLELPSEIRLATWVGIHLGDDIRLGDLAVLMIYFLSLDEVEIQEDLSLISVIFLVEDKLAQKNKPKVKQKIQKTLM
jgi:hypothetical protein